MPRELASESQARLPGLPDQRRVTASAVAEISRCSLGHMTPRSWSPDVWLSGPRKKLSCQLRIVSFWNQGRSVHMSDPVRSVPYFRERTIYPLTTLSRDNLDATVLLL